MALVKLPDGQVVEKNLVESVTSYEGHMTGHWVEIHLKGKKTISIPCKSELERARMLKSVHEALGRAHRSSS